MIIVVVLLVIASSDGMSTVFLEDPGEEPIKFVPIGTQAQLNCSVNDEYGILTWSIQISPDTVAETRAAVQLEFIQMMNGINMKAISVTKSILTINGSDINDGINVTCIAFEVDDPVFGENPESGTVQVRIYGTYV